MILLFLLLLSLPLGFLFSGWKTRKRSIVDGFSDDAIQFYFKVFHPSAATVTAEGWKKRFDEYYNSQFGRVQFVLPLAIFASVGGLLLCWVTHSVLDYRANGAIGDNDLPLLAIMAVMGAYMWVLSNEIAKWYAVTLSPHDIYWWCFRFAVAIPMGYAAKNIFTEQVALPVVFFLGAFPTTQLLTFVRRIATQKMGFKDSENGEISELQSLQGIDNRKAEQFAQENITTILQLAYCDPIRLTIRTGLGFSYITDCACQALLWIYLQKNVVCLQKCGLRSSYEALSLYLEIQDPDTKDEAEQVLREAAIELKSKETSLRNVLKQVALDQYSIFLYLSWSHLKKSDLSESDQEVLGIS